MARIKYGGKYGGWERDEHLARDIWLMVLVFALVLTMLVGFIGWIRYHDERILNNELMGLEYIPLPFPIDEKTGEVR